MTNISNTICIWISLTVLFSNLKTVFYIRCEIVQNISVLSEIFNFSASYLIDITFFFTMTENAFLKWISNTI